jgi:anaerobic selenocysteine-containing dehydrogenase
LDRRKFFHILSATSAGVLTSCNKDREILPLLVPEHEIVPGEEQWRAAVCTECGAGCGTLVRIMEGVRTVERNGQRFRERIAAIKKVEGNPDDPISGGRLCARGQATVQGLYHPDRVRGPLRRSGDRGTARFTPVAWDEAIAGAAEKIAKADRSSILFLTGSQVGARAEAIAKFTAALGAPAPVICSLSDFAIEREAARAVFGWNGLPVYDFAHARFVLGVGADFLGGWASPVYYARQFGHFRQGRTDVRGRLVQAESRLSITAGAADRWLPLRPGTEAQFLAAVGRLLHDAGLARQSVPALESVDADALLASCGLDGRRVREVVKELGESEAPLVLAGASIPHTNSLDAVMIGHHLNIMLGNVGKPGGIQPPQAGGPQPARRDLPQAAKVVLIDGANPAYTLPPSLNPLPHAETIISFANFIDDSAAWADFVLPDHHSLESEAVRPLYDTRALAQTLAALSAKLPAAPANDPPAAAPASNAWSIATAAFDGDPAQYPLQFQPYPSLQFHDGSGAHLPWLQELPDPTSSAIWGLPVEIDPKTAAQLHVANGDVVRVESPHGAMEAPAYVHPGAAPGVVSMAIGDGHTHYGRYASGRGANPISILAPVHEPRSGALALGATRVRIARAGPPRGFIQFAAPDREERGFDHR